MLRLFSIPLALLLLYPSDASAKVLFEIDADSMAVQDMYKQGSGCTPDNNGKFKQVKEPVRTGTSAVQITINDCDERAEYGLDNGSLKPNTDYFISFSYFIPENYFRAGQNKDKVYTIVFQNFHAGAGTPGTGPRGANTALESGCSHPMAYMLSFNPDGDYTFKFLYPTRIQGGKQYFGCKSVTIPRSTNAWDDFSMHVRFSTGKDGFMKIAKNGKLYDSYEGPTISTMYGIGNFKIGAYTGNPGNGFRTLYTDGFVVGTEYGDLPAPRPEQGQPQGQTQGQPGVTTPQQRPEAGQRNNSTAGNTPSAASMRAVNTPQRRPRR